MDAKITEILVCPLCKGSLLWNEKKKEFYCRSDMKAFPVIDGIPCMVPTEAREMKEEEIEELDKNELYRHYSCSLSQHPSAQ